MYIYFYFYFYFYFIYFFVWVGCSFMKTVFSSLWFIICGTYDKWKIFTTFPLHSIPNSERGLVLWQDGILNTVLETAYYGESAFYLEIWQDETDKSEL